MRFGMQLDPGEPVSCGSTAGRRLPKTFAIHSACGRMLLFPFTAACGLCGLGAGVIPPARRLKYEDGSPTARSLREEEAPPRGVREAGPSHLSAFLRLRDEGGGGGA